MSPHIRAVSHIAVGVRDMAEALRFYRDFLGLAVSLDQHEQRGRERGDGSAQSGRRAVYLRLAEHDDASFLVLDQQLDHRADGEPRNLFDVGFHHIAFWAEGLDALVAAAPAAGVTIVHGPAWEDSTSWGESAGRPIRTVIFRDFEGNIVQVDSRHDG
ncbi:VOC family protein [Pseudonocardia benzenivorans]|uniref:Glyoxalase/bleomycin resistance protein/dioxygenase n=2 Tax=Pseudonocardia TaxID=1847 RepID=F4CY62_PSEUX|nr:VOC family protein [Pseudonocardia dioxanivorans]AEA24684.1 Glyoxalase/bleomycin resistance protein/dioxygenase [Pseudonocardia dioxanivorans CB1190]GJF04611.1 hypothetical protein PSD17_35650 [Pseudonocardia sp. D17]